MFYSDLETYHSQEPHVLNVYPDNITSDILGADNFYNKPSAERMARGTRRLRLDKAPNIYFECCRCNGKVTEGWEFSLKNITL